MRKRWSREWTHFIRHWEERKTVDANEVNVYSVHDIRILKTRHKKRERLSTGSSNSHSFIRNQYFRHAMSFVLSLFLLGIINLYSYCQEWFKLPGIPRRILSCDHNIPEIFRGNDTILIWSHNCIRRQTPFVYFFFFLLT